MVEGKKVVIDDRESELCLLENGWIYYLVKNSLSGDSYDVLYRIKEDGSEKMALCEGLFSDITLHNSYIYFVNLSKTQECAVQGGNIYRMKCDGGELSSVNKSKASNLNIIDDNWIIYEKKAVFDERCAFRGVYKCGIDGSGYMRLTKGSCSIVDIVGGWIYYKVVGKEIKTGLYEIQLRKVWKNGTDDTYLLSFEQDQKSIRCGIV